MEHWHFDDLFFFDGSITLHNKVFPHLSIYITYENCNETIDRDVNLHGALQFRKVGWAAGPSDPEKSTPPIQLMKQLLRSKLPPNLTASYPTSAHLFKLDMNLNKHCLNAMRVCTEISDLCERRNAALKLENG